MERGPCFKLLPPPPLCRGQREIRENATLEEGMRETFAAMKREGKLVDPDESAARCTRLLLGGPAMRAWASGDHVDYYDVSEQ